MTDFRDVLRRRRMVRSYLPDPVDAGTVERIVDAARRGPTAGHSQGQELVVVTDPERRKAIAAAMDEALYVEQGGEPWVSTAPVHVVVVVREELYHDRYRQPDKLAQTGGVEVHWPVPYWFVDAGAAMMLLLLAAVDEGLAAGFCGHPDQERRLGELLELPAGAVPIGVVTIGHPAPDPFAERTSARTRRRRPVGEVVHWQRWGGAR